MKCLTDYKEDMTKKIKRIDIKEFREKGFLYEANRKFFHPLGLALEVIIDDDTGDEQLGGIWDYRGDPEGMFYSNDRINEERTKYIEDLRLSKVDARKKAEDVSVDDNGIQIKKE